MGFFDKVKNKLGIGGVKASLYVPGQVSKAEGKVEGKVTLTTKSEQKVVDLEIKVYEKWETGKGEQKRSKHFDLGQIKLPGNFIIKPSETKEIEFTVPFKLVKSNNEHLKDKGGALGALGKFGSFLDAENSRYYVEVDVDVEAAALDPSDKAEIHMV